MSRSSRPYRERPTYQIRYKILGLIWLPMAVWSEIWSSSLLATAPGVIKDD
jgi:hypothetical protein